MSTTTPTPALAEQITKIVLACTTINDEQKQSILRRMESDGLTDDLVAEIDRLCDEEIAATEQSIAEAEILLAETEEELRAAESVAAPAMERVASEAEAEFDAVEQETVVEAKRLEREFFAQVESDKTEGEQAQADKIRAQLKKAA